MYLPKKIFNALITYKTNAQAFDLKWPLRPDQATSLDQEDARFYYKEILQIYLKLQRCIEKRVLVKEYYESMKENKPSYQFPIQRAMEQRQHAETLMTLVVERMHLLSCNEKSNVITTEATTQPMSQVSTVWKEVKSKSCRNEDEVDAYWQKYLKDVTEEVKKTMDAWDDLLQCSLTLILQSFSEEECEKTIQNMDSWMQEFQFHIFLLMKQKQYRLDSLQDIIATKEMIYSDELFKICLRRLLKHDDQEIQLYFEMTKKGIVKAVLQESQMLRDCGTSPFEMQSALIRLLPFSCCEGQILQNLMPMWLLWLNDYNDSVAEEVNMTSNWKKRYLQAYTKRLPFCFQGNITEHANKMESLWRKFKGYDENGDEKIPINLWKKMYSYHLGYNAIVNWGGFLALQFDQQKFKIC